MNDLPIGVFDSGVGGLTVLKALQAVLPNESFVYLGDTARLPYGTKSQETVIQYACGASELIFKHQPIKMLVIACNTASTLAYEALCKAHPNLPVIDVVRPGARVAVENSQTQSIAVIATESTVNFQGYQKAIHAIAPKARVRARSAGVFVALAEEGWFDNDVAVAAAEHYLTALLTPEGDFKPDCLLLGCTHFPVLIPAIEMVINEKIKIVDSATATAMAVTQTLHERDLMAPSASKSQTQFLVTDSPKRFAMVAARFLDKPLADREVKLVGF